MSLHRATGRFQNPGWSVRCKNRAHAGLSCRVRTRCSQPTQLPGTPSNPSGNEFPLLGLGRIDTLLPGVYCFENAVWLRDLVPLVAISDASTQSAAAQLAALTARASATAAAASTSSAEAEQAAHAAAYAAAAAADAAAAASAAASLAQPASLTHPTTLLYPASKATLTNPEHSPAPANRGVDDVLGSDNRELYFEDSSHALSLDATAAHLAAVAALAAAEAVVAAQAAAEAASALAAGQARMANGEMGEGEEEEGEEPGYRTADRVSVLRVPMRAMSPTPERSGTIQPGQPSPSPPHAPQGAQSGAGPHTSSWTASIHHEGLQQRGWQLLTWLVQPVVAAVQALLHALHAVRAMLLRWTRGRDSTPKRRGLQGSGNGGLQGSAQETLQGHVRRTEERAGMKSDGAELHSKHVHLQDHVSREGGEGLPDAVAQRMQITAEDSQRSRGSHDRQDQSSSSSSSSSSGSSVRKSRDVCRDVEAPQSSMLVVSKWSRFKDPETGKIDYFKMAASANEYSSFVRHAQHTQHRNLVQMLGCARNAESLTLLSEFSEGGDLQQLLKKEQHTRRESKAQGRLHAAAGVGGVLLESPQVHAGLDGLSEQKLLHIARDLLAGLAALQRGGLTHGDIKPSNCFVSYTEGSPCDALELSPAAPTNLSGNMTSAAVTAATLDLAAPVAPTPLAEQVHATATPILASATASASATLEVAASVGPHPRPLSLAPHEPNSSAPSTLASMSTFSIDSSIKEEEDIEAVVLQPPMPQSTLGSVSTSGLGFGPALGLAADKQPTRRLAFAPSSANSGLLLPKEPKLRRSKVFKLGDYGTLREKGRQHLHYFVSGFGYTPEYAAPEALRYGTAKAHAPADIWAVGVTLLELLLGRLPAFAVKMRELQGPDDHKARQRWLSKNKPADLKDLHDAVAASQSAPPSPELQEVLSACLQLRPEERPQSAEELLSYSWFAAPASKAWLVEEEHLET